MKPTAIVNQLCKQNLALHKDNQHRYTENHKDKHGNHVTWWKPQYKATNAAEGSVTINGCIFEGPIQVEDEQGRLHSVLSQ